MNSEQVLTIPHFNDEDEERNFWATHGSTDYIDWSQAEQNSTFPNLKRSIQNDSTDDDHG